MENDNSQKIVITDFQMTLRSMVLFMVKFYFAFILSSLILALIFAAIAVPIIFLVNKFNL